MRFLTGTTGTATDTYVYDAFGLPVTTTGTTPNSFLYSGEQFDRALGMYYLRARYYNPASGRFLTMDPYEGRVLEPGTLHKYVFTGNNPVNANDPSGRSLPEYVFQLEVDIELKSPLGLEMRATAHVVEKALDCIEVLLQFGYSEAFSYELCMEQLAF